jgi:hypothetical protein
MNGILYETEEQRKHTHTSWEKVEAIDEIYWRCVDCRVTANMPVDPNDDPERANKEHL